MDVMRVCSAQSYKTILFNKISLVTVLTFIAELARWSHEIALRSAGSNHNLGRLRASNRCFLSNPDLRRRPLYRRHHWVSTSGPIIGVILECQLILFVNLLDSTGSSLCEGILTNQIRLVWTCSTYLEIGRWTLKMDDSLVVLVCGIHGWCASSLLLSHIRTCFKCACDTCLFLVGRVFTLRWLWLRVVEREVWSLIACLTLFLTRIGRRGKVRHRWCHNLFALVLWGGASSICTSNKADGCHLDNWTLTSDCHRATSA